MGQKSIILVVDDEQAYVKSVRIRLQSSYDVREAGSGEGALELLKTLSPKVIVLDLMMPGIDGYEVTRKVRANPRLSATKIILVSGRADIENKLEGYDAGADDYLAKPFNGEELRAKIENLIRLYDLESELRGVKATLEAEIDRRTSLLLDSEKLAFLGRHACDIVHNLRNPLAIVSHYVEDLQDKMPGDETVEKLATANKRVLQIVTDILSASAVDETKQPVDLSKVVREELEFLRVDHEARKKITVECRADSHTPVLAASVHMHQVVGNLIRNAVEAMYAQTAGKLTVATEDFEGYVLLTIQDSGPGILPENLDRIFEASFSTKKGENGGPVGTGLGLPYCKRMIESYGGRIYVRSEAGKGTVVNVKIPFPQEKENARAISA